MPSRAPKPRPAKAAPANILVHEVNWLRDLVMTEDVTDNEVEVSRRWHDARERRAAELIRLEGEETFAALQRFLATVHRLTRERRMYRLLYLVRKPRD